jgi:hypothetical protein
MMSFWGHVVHSYWGPRRETPAQCGVRFCRMVDELAKIDAAFSGWQFFGATRYWPLTSQQDDELTALIADGVTRDDYNEPEPEFGYRFTAGTRMGTKTALNISIHAGCYVPDLPHMANTADLRAKPLNEENAGLITLSVFKPAVVAIARAWDATWCAAYPWDILDYWAPPGPGQPHFRMAWITYLSARFAPLVTPPASAISERLPDGALLMIATEDRFDIDNPRHMEVARDIEAALAPVNALPWPPDAVQEN